MGIEIRFGAVILNKDVSAIFGVGLQGGMRRSLSKNVLVLISDHTRGVYEDRWEGDIIHFTGMGQKGHQTLGYQNRTLAESRTNGVVVHLFEVFERGKYTYVGRVALAGEPYRERQPDVDGNLRDVWMFPLRIVEGARPIPDARAVSRAGMAREKVLAQRPLETLRKIAMAAPAGPARRLATTEVIERNAAVSAYVKQAANGVCDLCRKPAPFRNRKGEAYLECHHIVPLAAGGEDSLNNAVALCPNCHRKMHVLNLEEDRARLEQRIREREGAKAD